MIDARLEELQKEMLAKAKQKDTYDAIADEILRLWDMRVRSKADSAAKDERTRRIAELQNFIKGQSAAITEFDETPVKRLIGKITVCEDKFCVELGSGITIDIDT